MKETIEELRRKLESLLGLEKNWGSYDEEEITLQSICTAHKVLDRIYNKANWILITPMRDGGIQFDLGHYKEYEIYNYEVKEMDYDNELNLINVKFYTI